ncbi:hypothetical protein JRQ81_001337, partial [Phrynocephalus forsythii]
IQDDQVVESIIRDKKRELFLGPIQTLTEESFAPTLAGFNYTVVLFYASYPWPQNFQPLASSEFQGNVRCLRRYRRAAREDLFSDADRKPAKAVRKAGNGQRERKKIGKT